MGKKSPRVAILIPETGTVSADWAMQLLKLQGKNRVFFTSRGEPLDITRNKLVDRAMEDGAEWLFFLDSDVILPNGAIDRLLLRNRPIVSGLYKLKMKSGEIWCAGVKAKDEEGFNLTNASDWGGELVEVDVTGAGCLLVHRKVFETIREKYPKIPWFLHCTRKGYNPQEFPDPSMYNVSEDIFFCLLAKACGFQVIIDTTVRCGHIATVMLVEDGVRVLGEKL